MIAQTVSSPTSFLLEPAEPLSGEKAGAVTLPSPGGPGVRMGEGPGVRVPPIPYLRLRFVLRAAEKAFLPPFKGSLLRGAFGHALKRSVCSMGPSQACPDCLLRRACLYTRLFETFTEGLPLPRNGGEGWGEGERDQPAPPPPFLHGIPTSPRPYVFEPLGEEQDFAPGDPLAFDLLLFGQATELSAHALLAVERMARSGLGARRVLFVLDRVGASRAGGGWQEVYKDGKAFPALGSVPPLFPSEAPVGEDRLTLRFLTPTRIPLQGRYLEQPDFRRLTFAMLRRTLEMAWLHLPAPQRSGIDWHLRPLLERASDVKVLAADLRWHDWQRYSNRQGRKITLGGFMGTMTLEGDLAPFAPLLRTAEVLHVGKGATFGLGRLAVGP